MKIFTPDGYVANAALFFEVNDEQLKMIGDDVNYCLNIEKVKGLVDSSGEHAHIYRLINPNGFNIHKYMTILLKDYKSVSWWDRDLNKFQIRRR